MEMITKLEYFEKIINEGYFIQKRDWLYKAFSIPILKDGKKITDHELGDLFISSDGLFIVGENNTKVIIKDYNKNEPLFKFHDRVNVKKGFLSSIKEDMETSYGRLLLNSIVFNKDVRDRLPYFNTRISPTDIENELAKRVTNPEDKQTENSITVEEMITIIDNMQFLEILSDIVIVGATAKTIMPTPGVSELKKKLYEDNADKLNDPLTLVAIEDAIKKHNADYLKDDLTALNTFGGKAEVGLMKMYGSLGNTLDFVKDASNDTLIKRSISEGIDTNPEEFKKYINDLRLAIYSRGSMTALGGYTYKILQRALNTITVTPTACNTTRGLLKVIDKGEAPYSIGRYVKDNGKWVPINNVDDLKKYIGKPVEMRSPMFCKEKGNNICYACVSLKYKNMRNGVSNIASGVSSVILTMFLKLMHGIKTNAATIEKDDLIN